MKGMVFTCLQEMVEEKFGLKTWNLLLNNVNPESEGVYTAGLTYKDSELQDLVVELSSIVDIPPPQLVEAFGVYLFPVLAQKYSIFVQNVDNLKDFIKSIDGIIHVEVHKLNPEASLPSISCQEHNPKEMTLIYDSPRKLCALAVGMLKGASDYYKTKTEIYHSQCMHDGASKCHLEIKFEL